MNHQTLIPHKGHTLYIATPMGLMMLQWQKKGRWLFTGPEGVRVFKDQARAIEACPFMYERDDGTIAPAYNSLVPITDDSGALIGAREGARTLRLRATIGDSHDLPEHGNDGSVEAVAIAHGGGARHADYQSQVV